MTSLLVERVESEQALSALEPDWSRLEVTTGNGLPFRTFAWNACWWKHLREDGLRLKDSLAVRAVRTADGKIVGIAPLMLTQRPGAGPVRVRLLQFMGADPNITEVRGALCDPSHEAACYEAVLADIASTTPDIADCSRILLSSWTTVTLSKSMPARRQ